MSKIEVCVECGQGPAVTTEGLCEICDRKFSLGKVINRSLGTSLTIALICLFVAIMRFK